MENNAITTVIKSIPSEQQRMLDQYASILEKTNQQLGLWSNPYGIMVGILSVLIAVIAIVVAYALWRNSEEQKKSQKDFFEKQEKNIQNVMTKYNDQVQKVEEKLGNLIKEYENQLKDKTKNKKELQQVIDGLKKEKASIGAYIGPMGALSARSTIANFIPSGSIYSESPSFRIEKSMICVKCGEKFSYYNDMTLSMPKIIHINSPVYCSLCGAKNISQ